MKWKRKSGVRKEPTKLCGMHESERVNMQWRVCVLRHCIGRTHEIARPTVQRRMNISAYATNLIAVS
jgi:hypothetical protein